MRQHENVKFYAVIQDKKDGRTVEIGAWNSKALSNHVRRILHGAPTISGTFDENAIVKYYTVYC